MTLSEGKIYRNFKFSYLFLNLFSFFLCTEEYVVICKREIRGAPRSTSGPSGGARSGGCPFRWKMDTMLGSPPSPARVPIQAGCPFRRVCPFRREGGLWAMGGGVMPLHIFLKNLNITFLLARYCAQVRHKDLLQVHF